MSLIFHPINSLLFCSRVYYRVFACLNIKALVTLILGLKSPSFNFWTIFVFIVSNIEILNLDAFLYKFLECFHFTFCLWFWFMTQKRAFDRFGWVFFVRVLLFKRWFDGLFIEGWLFRRVFVVNAVFVVDFRHFMILFLFFWAIGPSNWRHFHAFLNLVEFDFSERLLDRFFYGISDGYLVKELRLFGSILVAFRVVEVVGLMGKELVIGIVLGVLREVVEGAVLDFAEFVKVFVLVVRVLDATDKFGNPWGCIVALICL